MNEEEKNGECTFRCWRIYFERTFVTSCGLKKENNHNSHFTKSFRKSNSPTHLMALDITISLGIEHQEKPTKLSFFFFIAVVAFALSVSSLISYHVNVWTLNVVIGGISNDNTNRKNYNIRFEWFVVTYYLTVVINVLLKSGRYITARRRNPTNCGSNVEPVLARATKKSKWNLNELLHPFEFCVASNWFDIFPSMIRSYHHRKQEIITE